MFPKMNPKQMKKMMRQMGMEMTELDAREVVIRLADKEITIQNPSVSLVEVQGQRTYQIAGGTEMEGAAEAFTPEDVELVASQAKVSLEAARKALEESEGDIAEAIVNLTK